MLKLRYRFDNRDLAIMILENWEYDPSSIGMLDYFRISSNAIYPFEYKGKRRFLRFAPCAEKDKNNILGELDFIRYLKQRGYPVLCTVSSKDSRELLKVNTPWGEYFAVVFESVALEKIYHANLHSEIKGQYVAELSGEIVGFISLTFDMRLSEARKVAVIDELVVNQKHRNKGIGTALIEYTVKLAKSTGCCMVEVATNFRREDTHRFYEKNKFIKNGYRFDYDSF